MDDMKQQTQQDPLPFDDGADQPVEFALTARAKRAVAPHALPALSVVPRRAPEASTDIVEPSVEDPADTRPSRARALRRAGRSTDVIAQSLGVDEVLVRAWVGDVAPQTRTRTPQTPADGLRTTRSPDRRRASAGGSEQQDADLADHERSMAFSLARAAASEQARTSRLSDPAFAAGLGLIAGIIDVDRNAATLTTHDQDIAVLALRWLDQQLAIDPSRVRVVLRVGTQAAGDLASYRWAAAMGVARERVTAARWRDAPDPESVQALVRLADPAVAATLAGWRDALLDPAGPDPADVAF